MEGDQGKGKGELDSQAENVTAEIEGKREGEKGRRRQNRMRDKA